MKLNAWMTAAGVGILLLPAFLIGWLGGEFRQLLTPYFLLNWDPDYGYLFNGLAIYSGVGPTHIDHPGTTLQIAITAFLAVSEWGTSASQLYTRVLADPESYLLRINQGLVAANALVAILSGLVVWRRFNSLAAAILAPVGIFLSPSALLGMGRVTPEPMLVIVSLLVLIVAVMTGKCHERTHRVGALILSGLLVGAGLSTKLTFLPILALGYYFARSRVEARRWILFVGVGFLICTTPWLLRLRNYFDFLRWFTNLSVGAGIYGGGPRTVIDAAAYLPSLLDLIRNEWMYASVILTSALFAWLGRNWEGEEGVARQVWLDWRRLLLSLLLVHCICFLLVAKHPQSTRYLIPCVALAGFTLNLSLMVWGRARPDRHWRGAQLLAITLAAGLAWQALSIASEAAVNTKLMQIGAFERQQAMLRKEPYRSCIQVHRDSSTPQFALAFGLTWGKARPDIAAEVERSSQFSDVFFYDPNLRKFYSVVGRLVDEKEIRQSGRCVVLLDVMDLKML